MSDLLRDLSRSIQGHVARAARGAVRSGPLRQPDVLRRLQEGAGLGVLKLYTLERAFFCMRLHATCFEELSSENLPEEMAMRCDECNSSHAHTQALKAMPKDAAPALRSAILRRARLALA